jgi:DNA-binding MarR family transcriptional regulator
VEAVAEALHFAALHLLRRLRVQDEALGISAPRLSALSVLVFAGPLRLGQLASLEQVEPPTMTRLVDALEAEGLATRGPDPADARATLVSATDLGTRVLRQGQRARVRSLADSLRSLSSAELELLGKATDLIERAARPSEDSQLRQGTGPGRDVR